MGLASHRLARALRLAAFVPPAIATFILVSHWSPLPCFDEWSTPGAQIAAWTRGTLTSADLFAQHNEHRLFFPRLVYLALTIFGGWDVRREMALSFVLVCTGAFALSRFTTRAKLSPSRQALLFLLASALLFSPREYENFLSTIDGGFFFTTVALLFALLTNLSRLSFSAKTLVNLLLAAAATFSFGNGMLLWIFAFPLNFPNESGPIESARRKNFCRLIFLLAAVASIALYFHDYRHPALSAPFASPWADKWKLFAFLFRWLGNPFLTNDPALFGGLVCAIFCGLALTAIHRARQKQNWSVIYPWLSLGAYVFVSGAIVALARVRFVLQMAGDFRYAAHTIFFWIATLGLAFVVFGNDRRRSQNRAVLALSTLLVAALWLLTFTREIPRLHEFVRRREHLALVLRWSLAIPDNPELAALSQYPETIDTIRTLDEFHLLRPRLISRQLSEAVRQKPPENFAAASGEIFAANEPADTAITLRGVARLPGENRAPDCVVLGFIGADGAWHLLGVTEVSRGAFSYETKRPGLRGDAVKFGGWTIDLKGKRAFPLKFAETPNR